MLTRDAILAAKPALVPADAPEWGGTIYLRRLGPVEFSTISDANAAGQHAAGAVLAVLYGAAAEDGARLFDDGDRAWLETQPQPLILRLGEAVLRHTFPAAAAEEPSPGN